MDRVLKNHLLENSLEGIVVTDLQGTILACNQAARTILGYGRADLTEEYVGILFPPTSASHLLPNLMHLACREDGFDGEIVLLSALGDPVMVRLLAEGWPQDDPTSILFRFLDWREVHEIMRQLRESSQMAVLGTLTRSMSHEILNPVSVIGSFTRRLLDHSSSSDPKKEEWARQVMSSVERLESMVETVQSYLDLPSPRFSMGSLDAVIDDSLLAFRNGPLIEGIRIVESGRRGPWTIFMDRDLLGRALNAALVNAALRMPSGGDLTVTRGFEDDHGLIRIHDTGPSLDMSQIEEDLSPIHVIGTEKTHLNLATARRIVDEHGGFLALRSPDSGGLDVEFRLPADRRALARNRLL